MSTIESPLHGRGTDDGYRGDVGRRDRHRYEEEDTETRRSFVTSEFWLLLVACVAVLFFAYDSGVDSLTRTDAWRFVTYLNVAYFISRGLSKAGSYESFRRER